MNNNSHDLPVLNIIQLRRDTEEGETHNICIEERVIPDLKEVVSLANSCDKNIAVEDAILMEISVRLIKVSTSIHDSVVKGKVDCKNGIFEGGLSLFGVTLEGEVDFSGTNFKKRPLCTNCIFKKRVTFSDASFEEGAVFTNCDFREETCFDKTYFAVATDFSGSIFRKKVTWNGAIFKDGVDLSGSKFEGGTEPADFHGLYVEKADPADRLASSSRKENIRFEIGEELSKTLSKRISRRQILRGIFRFLPEDEEDEKKD